MHRNLLAVPEPIHLRPTAPVADRALLPGDPGRALLLAQALLESPRMFNHHRGLWGYTGTACDGRPLSIQSTGMGGPSAAIVIAELAEMGVATMLRVGTCGGLVDHLALGDIVVATAALTADGTSRALGAGDSVEATPSLVARLRSAGAEHVHAGPIVSTDLFYDAPEGMEAGWRDRGALAVEMEAAALFSLAQRRGFAAGCALIVSDSVLPQRRRIEDDALRAAEHRLGEIALAALVG
jgi:DeoD family purine-nucleoside phosphorylase